MSKPVTISIEAQIKDIITERQEISENILELLFSNIEIKYDDLEKKVLFDRKTALYLSKLIPDLIIGGCEGEYWISAYTIMSTITKVLTGKSLVFTLDENRNIIGGRFIPDGESKLRKI